MIEDEDLRQYDDHIDDMFDKAVPGVAYLHDSGEFIYKGVGHSPWRFKTLSDGHVVVQRWTEGRGGPDWVAKAIFPNMDVAVMWARLQ